MNESLSRAWWIYALRGVLAILFGVFAIMWPGLTLLSLIVLFAVYVLLSGAASVIGAMRMRKHDEDWWLPLLLGLVSIGAGVIAIMHPELTTLVLVLVIGANALITGVLDIATAIRLRKTIRNEWLMILSGAVSIVFGVLVFLFPAAGALALVWLISLYAFVTGLLMFVLAMRLRTRITVGAAERRITPDRRATPAH